MQRMPLVPRGRVWRMPSGPRGRVWRMPLVPRGRVGRMPLGPRGRVWRMPLGPRGRVWRMPLVPRGRVWRMPLVPRGRVWRLEPAHGPERRQRAGERTPCAGRRCCQLRCRPAESATMRGSMGSARTGRPTLSGPRGGRLVAARAGLREWDRSSVAAPFLRLQRHACSVGRRQARAWAEHPADRGRGNRPRRRIGGRLRPLGAGRVGRPWSGCRHVCNAR